MKKLIYLTLSLFLLFSLPTYSQKKIFTIEEATTGMWQKFAPKNLHSYKWRTNTNYFSFVEKYSTFSQENAHTLQTKVLFTLNDLNKLLEKAGLEQLSYLYAYNWEDENILSFETGENFVLFNVNTKKIEKYYHLGKKAKNIHYNHKAKAVAFTIANNLFLTFGDEPIAITNDKNKGIVNGSNYVHRQEFGINNGIFWSPKGNYIAFYRKDESMVADYPILKIHSRPAHDSLMKYPMAGNKSEEVTLGVYNVKTQKTVFMKTGEPKEQYLTAITWEPSENNMYIGVLNRDQNHLKLNKYQISNGELVKTLFEEKNDRYVEPEHPLYFIPNKNEFLWYSRRDGFNHLYQYNTDGKLIKQITKGNWLVTDFLGFDAKAKNIIIQSTKESPLDRDIYKVNIKNQKITRLTKAKAYHTAKFNQSNNLLIDSYSSIEIPRVINVINASTGKAKNILKAENTLKEYNLPEMKIGTLKAADGKTDLYYRLIKPANFDPNKKYPAIIYVYGGPHAQLITNRWHGGVRLWQYYMAQHGYVMLTVDNRGSANRGFEFESVIHRKLGQNEMADQMKGLDMLKSLGYVDMNRIGVHGWSFGGFMTTSLMLNHNDVFKVGVAGGPVMDWSYYEVMYGERYMDTPQENPEGYKLTSCLNKTANLKGKFLIIFGLLDPVVVPQNSFLFFNKCIATRTFPVLYPYGDHEHNVRGKDRIHLMEMISNFFFENL